MTPPHNAKAVILCYTHFGTNKTRDRVGKEPEEMPSDLDDQIIALFATLSDNEKREFIRLFSAAVEEQASQTSSQDQPGVTGP